MVSLDHQGMLSLESCCSQNNPPRCQVRCPFNLDSKALLLALRQGKLREARKVLQRSMPLPALWARLCDHPCEHACLRQELGGAVAMGELERYLVSHTDAAAAGLAMPAKKQTVAVFGLGLAGIVCAADLVAKGYKVECYHTNDAQSALRMLAPELDCDWQQYRGLEADWQKFVGSIRLIQVPALDDACLREAKQRYAACFVDMAVCLMSIAKESCCQDTLLWQEHCCAGGWQDPDALFPRAQAAEAGRIGAATMDRLVAGVSLTAARARIRQSPHMSTEGFTPLARLQHKEKATDYSLEEIKQEAARCMQCQCLRCVHECAYMQKYNGYPKLYTRMIFNNLTIAQGIRKANSLITGCALCRQCEELCPDHFSMTDLCLTARQELVRKKFMPESAFEFALEEMEAASNDACAFIHAGRCLQENEDAEPGYVFFPGCQLAGTRPQQVMAVHTFLDHTLHAGVGIYLSCCGSPAYSAGEEERFLAHIAHIRAQLESLGSPKIICACASCLRFFQEYLPEFATTSLWELLDALDLPETDPFSAYPSLPKTLVIQDPCAARYNDAWQQAVRSLAEKCGITIEEPKRTGRQTGCCGYGGNQWCSDPQAATNMARNRADHLLSPALASCSMCRDRLADQGLDCWHILDLLPFGPKAESGLTPSTLLSQKRVARAELKRMFMRELMGKESCSPAPTLKFRYAWDMLRSLEDKQILNQDVEATLLFGLEKQNILFDQESGHSLTSYRPRKVTYWVEFSQEADGTYVVYDVWCHRTRVPGAGGENPSNAQ